jgi:GNAT superfamily N-acetyltransferase
MSGAVDWALGTAGVGDIPQLRRLWAEVFGDEERYIDTFFSFYPPAETAVVGRIQGKIVSAIYRVPMGGMCAPDGQVTSASITYALATYPEHRGHGIGAGVMKRAIQSDFDRGYFCNALCPAEDSLFPFYTSRIGYQDSFVLREALFLPETLPESDGLGSIRPAAPEAYNACRERLLAGRFHMRFDDRGICYQKRLCRDAGGDLYLLEGDHFEGCAACEEGEDGTWLVKELLCPPGRELACAQLLRQISSAPRWRVRTPADRGQFFGGGKTRRFAQMMCADGSTDFQSYPNAYYGFAFD